MKTHSQRVLGVLFAVSIIGASSLRADLNDSAKQAVSSDPAAALTAQNILRDAGPDGLQALEQTYAKEITAHRNGAPDDASWKKIAAALNHVSGQYDDYASSLYWYTDMDKAMAAAKASGKPILSLRLLGRLDQDLSCANSRFFRTTLYPNTQVNQLLRDKFVLFWESVRPAPVITIVFGDGRKLVRTITGNSIHYVLTPDGTLVDALPGLYSAHTFATELQLAADGATKCVNAQLSIANYQDNTKARLLAAWKKDLAATPDHGVLPDQLTESAMEAVMNDARWKSLADNHLNEVNFDAPCLELMSRKLPADTGIQVPPSTVASVRFFTAPTASVVAVSKVAIERPMITQLQVSPTPTIPVSFDQAQSTLVFNTAQFMHATTPDTLTINPGMNVEAPARLTAQDGTSPAPGSSMYAPMPEPAPKGIIRNIQGESPLQNVLPNLRQTVALDTVHDNYLLRTKILVWLDTYQARHESLPQINDYIYANIFLTPKDDQWLGLAPQDVFTGIDQNGETP